MTRSGDFLDFGQLFKAFGNNKFAQISHILVVKSFLDNFYRHLAICFLSNCYWAFFFIENYLVSINFKIDLFWCAFDDI